MSDQISKLEASDAELIGRAQSGDSDAFGELWKRHYRSAARVARQVTSSIDADDLVSEAYARIYQRILAGGGPTGGFRPYLYTTIRNLAATWGTAEARSINVEAIEDVEDDRIPDDPAAWALDRTLTARAFRTLPERWQTVLWYTEVEGLDPHEVAPIMGMTPNGVAALSYRAREGLRTAWLQAHISDATASGECRWTIARLGGHARNSLTDRERTRLEAHLVGCAKCTIISEEVEEVGSHLALVLVPLTLGGVAGGALLSQMSAGSALAAGAVPALPASIAALGGGSAVATGAAATSAAMPALIGGLAIAAALGGSVIVGPSSSPPAAAPAPSAITASAAPRAASTPTTPLTAVGSGTAGASPGSESTADAVGSTANTVGSGVGGTVGGATSGLGSTVGGVTSGLGSTVGGVASGVGSTVGGVTSGLGSTVGGVASGVGSTVGGVTSGLGSTVGGVTSGVGSALPGPVGGAVSGTGSTVGGAVSGVGSAVGGAVDGAGSAVGGILGGVGGTVRGLLGGSGGPAH